MNRLTESEREKQKRLHLINEKDVKRLEAYSQQPYFTPKERATAGMWYGRFRKRFLKTIETLAYAATLLPEKEKEKILTAETVKPLIQALLAFEPEKNSDKNSKKKPQIVKNKRAFRIAYNLAVRGEEEGFDMINDPYSGLIRENLRCKRWAMDLVIHLSDIPF